MPSASHSSGSRLTTDQATAFAGDLAVQPLALQRGEQLGVVEPGDLPRLGVVEDDRRRDQRTGAGAPSGLVRAGHRVETHPAERALVAVDPTVTSHRGHQQLTPSGSITASSRRRLGRGGHLGENGGLAQPGGPVERRRDREGWSDHLVDRARTRSGPCPVLARIGEVAAGIGTHVAMVAHHEDPVGGHHDLEPHVGGVDLDVVGVGVEIAALVQRIAVDGDPAVVVTADHAIARQADHPLDQVARACSGWATR